MVVFYCDIMNRTNVQHKEGHMVRGPNLQLDSKGRKRCPACKEYKKLIEFNMNKGKRFDRNIYCKQCESKRRRKNYIGSFLIINSHKCLFLKKGSVERVACGSATGNSFNTSFLHFAILTLNGARIAFRCRAL